MFALSTLTHSRIRAVHSSPVSSSKIQESSETVSKLDKFVNYQKQYEEFYEEMTDEERIEGEELGAEEATLRAQQEREEKRLRMMEEL